MDINNLIKDSIGTKKDSADKNSDITPGTGAGIGFSSAGAAKTAQKYGFALPGGSMQSSILTGGHNNSEKSTLDDGIADTPNWVDTQLSPKNSLSPFNPSGGPAGLGMWALAALKRRWGR